MSAERDQQQGMTFIYSNFYQLYRQGKFDGSKHEVLAKGKILKVLSHTETPVPAEVHVINSQQTEEWSNWAHQKGSKSGSRFHGMREHLRSLREAKNKLKFLSEELDEILKRS